MKSLSPGQRAWRRFKQNRLGYISLWIFAVAFALSLVADILSNDRPVVVHYQGQYYFPLVHSYPEKTLAVILKRPPTF